MEKRKGELSPDEVYELATRVKKWEPLFEDYTAKVGNLTINLHREKTATPLSISVYFDYLNPKSKESESVSIGHYNESVDDKSTRGRDLYDRIKSECIRKSRWQKTRATTKALEEAVRLISDN